MRHISLSVFHRGLSALLVIVSMPLWAAPGDLDATFGGGGKVYTDFGENTMATSIVQQQDGRIVGAGGGNNFAVARYNQNGSLDTSFSGDGMDVTTFAGSGAATSLIQQNDGKLLVGGGSYNGANYDFSIVRYNQNGSLDTTFDGDGKLLTEVGSGDDWVTSIAEQSDGKLLAAGRSYNGADYDFSIVRYNQNGSLDTTFDGDGRKLFSISSGNDMANSLVIQPSGKFVLGGTSDGKLALARFNFDGSIDLSFGNNGIFISDIAETSYEVINHLISQSDGKIVAAGSAIGGDWDFVVMRLSADGQMDQTFSNGGILRVGRNFGSGEQAESVSQLSDGKLIVAGTDLNSAKFLVMRLTAGGELDVGFGVGGMLLPYLTNEDYAGCSVVQSDGKFIVAGRSRVGGSYNVFSLVRVMNDDIDTDHDGIFDNVDNCPTVSNVDQNNSDNTNDGGDICDENDDNDQFNDSQELILKTDPLVFTDFSKLKMDSDGDGITDDKEIAIGTNPDLSDSDGDELSDDAEIMLYCSNANSNDSDGDGIHDDVDPEPNSQNKCTMPMGGLYKGSVIKDGVGLQ